MAQETIGDIVGNQPGGTPQRQADSAVWANQTLDRQLSRPQEAHVGPQEAHIGPRDPVQLVPDDNGPQTQGTLAKWITPHWYNWGANLDPYLRALTGRIAYLGLKGTLLSNDGDWKNALGKTGSVGQQLLERIGGLEGRGWSIGSLGMTDPFWDLTKTSWLGRTGRMFTLGGYHWDLHEGTAVKRIAINRKVVALSNAIGASFGGSDTPKGIAVLMAHEVSHEDGILREHAAGWQSLPLEEQKTLAKRMIATETRAILSQLYVAQELGDHTITNERARAALQGGRLGSFIHEHWGKSGNQYNSFKTITPAEADSFASGYMEETFGKNLYNRFTGRVRTFDINAGLDKQIGAISGDQELAESMKVLRPGLRPAETAISRLLESRSGGALLRGGQALGAVGLLAATNDLEGAFETSGGTGMGRLSRIGVDWAGFELGTTGGAVLGRAVIGLMGERCLSSTGLSLLIMGSGMLGAHLGDSKVGTKVEKFVKTAVDSGLKRARQLFS